ncbi:MAG: hypothetical protein Sylvanvirus1_86 [Sylvanvirus sp.]|uniref:Uncharacterized protein n=1 Tax=Sylvanvirus sp. TaxID=2487774 RepID=A0A3G5AH66_9VIRU|nr:MAG: hypothetical protein Sylvanvirus1_86 [Sylvanvirus sp.]
MSKAAPISSQPASYLAYLDMFDRTERCIEELIDESRLFADMDEKNTSLNVCSSSIYKICDLFQALCKRIIRRGNNGDYCSNEKRLTIEIENIKKWARSIQIRIDRCVDTVFSDTDLHVKQQESTAPCVYILRYCGALNELFCERRISWSEFVTLTTFHHSCHSSIVQAWKRSYPIVSTWTENKDKNLIEYLKAEFLRTMLEGGVCNHADYKEEQNPIQKEDKKEDKLLEYEELNPRHMNCVIS